MREIKFRALYGGEMIKVGQIEFFTDGSIHINQELVGAKVMQFTGLLDRSGKEIYEGDIVKNERVDKLIIPLAKVFWLDGSFRIGDIYQNTDLIHQIQESEVIGNIYENPELIK